MGISFFSLFSLKDLVDIVLVGTLLFYIYRLMKDSGSLNVFFGVLAFVIAWVVMYKIMDMRLIGTIMDKFIDIGLFILVILFQDQIRQFLSQIGSHKGLRFLNKLFKRADDEGKAIAWLQPIVMSCMSLSKSKTGALIVIEQSMPLTDYERTGDMINADINSRLIENIFFKNSPLHDGAMIVANGKIVSAGCILPVSHDTSIPRYLGLRHRSAKGIAQATDAIAIIVSEETGNISYAYKGELYINVSNIDLDHAITAIITENNQQ